MSKIIYIRKSMLPIFSTLLILSTIIYSHLSIKSASNGISLWINVVFPSLFPFLVCSEILSQTGFIRWIGVLLDPIMRPLFNLPGCGCFALITGITSGFPVGAKITVNLKNQGLITKLEAERLVAFTNNSGPLFILGAVSVGMLKAPKVGIWLLVCHILSSITVGILFRFYGRKCRTVPDINDVKTKNLIKKLKSELRHSRLSPSTGDILTESIKSSISTMLSIGGFIILFSVIINLLLTFGILDALSGALCLALKPIMYLDKNLVKCILAGSVEITNGANLLSQVTSISFSQKITGISIILAGSGISVYYQVISIIANTDISPKPYILGKLIHACFAGIYTYIICKIINF